MMDPRLNRAIVLLDEITPEDEPRSGAKAYNCARLKQAGFPVPDGLVILSTATEREVAALANHRWFDRLPAGVLFAVRSSGIDEDGAGESFAGIHDTILNVPRGELSVAIAKCRASGRSSQALAYRHSRGISTDDIAMGVLIQRMIQPSAAGVAFTVNLVTGADDELVINSSWGLGEALVSGLVDPDELVVRKQDGELLWSRLGDKGDVGQSGTSSMTPAQIGALAATLNGIEQHYGAPQDVEWCHDGSSFWIVQARPQPVALDQHCRSRRRVVSRIDHRAGIRASRDCQRQARATTRSRTGERVRLDAVQGLVHKLPSTPVTVDA